MKIDHVALYVKDIEKAKDFFVRYFKGKSGNLYHNKKTDFQSYFISFENGSRLEIMTRPEIVDSKNAEFPSGFAHIAISVGSKEKVDELTEELAADGYKIISRPRTTGDGYYESCALDFEGNRIEITV